MNELTISLDGTSSVPLYEQIYKYIKSDIQNGGLPFQRLSLIHILDMSCLWNKS